jgi:hypothetical protein
MVITPQHFARWVCYFVEAEVGESDHELVGVQQRASVLFPSLRARQMSIHFPHFHLKMKTGAVFKHHGVINSK